MLINDAVRITAGLLNSHLASPAIGQSNLSATTGFTEGDIAQDNYVNVGTIATALNDDLNGTGFIMIANPGPLEVNILSGATAIGPIPPGTSSNPVAVVLPLADNAVINATVASGTQTVGVTVIKVTPNA